MKRACAALACMALFPAWAERESFRIDPAHTRPQFEVSHLGISTQRGRFDRTAGSAWLDRAEGTGAVEVEIDAGSASTGDAKLDKALLGEDFLDVAHHPRIAFRADRIVFEAGVPVKAQGTLTLLGKARPVDLEIRGFACTRKPFLVRTTCGADAVATISRSAFGMGSFAGFIGDEVRIVIQVEAVKEESAGAPTTSQPGG
ncbi:MAG: YceI family protein [Usitatibacter sp.]